MVKLQVDNDVMKLAEEVEITYKNIRNIIVHVIFTCGVHLGAESRHLKKKIMIYK